MFIIAAIAQNVITQKSMIINLNHTVYDSREEAQEVMDNFRLPELRMAAKWEVMEVTR